ncbi:MAG: acetolactate synthase [Oscillospiraceae bacterium]|jgi:hypothetical protein|nr:acetolactate synthase [Oscillospiraceae bacterium]
MEQVSVFIENKPGRLADILRYLAQQTIDLRAYSFAETSDFGIMRMLVRDTDAAVAALRRGGYTARKNDVLGLLVADETGSTVEAFQLLGEAGVNVEYTYAFALGEGKDAFILLRVDDDAKAEEVLTQAGMRLVNGQNF